MIHIGIDHHKRYSVAIAIDDAGEVRREARLDNSPEAWRTFRESLPPGEPVQSVLEAGRSWGTMFDQLSELGFNPKLANPLKMRLIAETFVKTDRIDASTHAIILKAGLTPLVHVPNQDVRHQKDLLRQKAWLVRFQTMIKNRIHGIVDRNHQKPPERTDLFGSHGRMWLNRLELPDADNKLLKSHLDLLDVAREQIKQAEAWIDEALRDNPNLPILMSLPGVGKFFGALIALEIDTIDRFPSSGKLCAYSGLIASTYSSGGKTTHGGLIRSCNRHLRYAFIEASWSSVRNSPYFESIYTRLKPRLGSLRAITAVARKLCEITFACLKNDRPYEERPYRFRRVALSSA
jgi:transposase